MMDIPKAEREEKARIAGRANSILTDKDIVAIRGKLDNGATLTQIMKEYGIAKATVSYIKNRVTYNYLD